MTAALGLRCETAINGVHTDTHRQTINMWGMLGVHKNRPQQRSEKLKDDESRMDG